MPNPFQLGQRWVSEGEPELGLGEVRSVSARTVTLVFDAVKESRKYPAQNAPLRRVEFRTGDTIQTIENISLKVQAVREQQGLLYYDCGHHQVCERELNSWTSFSGPKERFFAGHFDPSCVFDLRLSALTHQFRRRKSEVRGFLGGRIDLLPHQLSIAAEVAGRLLPRVLLADEVGLGKTIEACLILHRLILTGRARRVLILVPESLVHQWFLELMRRFNLWFHIFDEARCQAIEKADPGTNPFLDDQLLLCELGLFTGKSQRLSQALAAGWDLLIVDEAHHLGWSPEEATPEYGVVEALGHRTPGLLLLTATPEQLGMAGHFARLRLLDPDRFFDLEEFLQESEGYRQVARLAERLREGLALSAIETEQLGRLLGESETLETNLANPSQGQETLRKSWVDALLDQHGTGRVMFRNTRATMAGFTPREARLYPLKAVGMDQHLPEALAKEWAADARPGAGKAFHPDFSKDPRIPWLAGLLHALGEEKVLLICRTRGKAEAIETALKQHLTQKMAVFHEGLSLVQRDRSAAWFAEKSGARLLICSEIGSEGRNFQFAHHLVLFDLPLDPALLEQRMGRLDRIGQAFAIQIHVPFVVGTHLEVLARWYQEGLNAFEGNLQGSQELLEQFESQICTLAKSCSAAVETELERLIKEVREARRVVTERLEQGRDRLLEWNSFKPSVSDRLIQEIRKQDESCALDDFMLAILDLFFIDVEEVAPRTYQLGSAGVLVEAFPGLTSEGLTLTCDRQRALVREDLQFLTWDHPLVSGALDLLLGSEKGNSSFARWPDAGKPGFYVEAIYLAECLAPQHFHVDRFLPPTPIRVMVDHRGLDVGKTIPHRTLSSLLKPEDGRAWLERPEFREVLLPRLLDQAQQLARHKLPSLVAQAREAMKNRLECEIARLRDLQKVNRSVRSEEIEALVEQQRTLDHHLGEARLRLDALRLIHRGPFRG